MTHIEDHGLQLYLDGQVSDRKRFRVDSHLASCPSCAQRLAELRNLVDALKGEPEVTLPPNFAHKFVQRIRDPLAPRIWRADPSTVLGSGIACLSLLAVCFFLAVIEGPLSAGVGDPIGAISFFLGSPFEIDSNVVVTLALMAILGCLMIGRSLSRLTSTVNQSGH